MHTYKLAKYNWSLVVTSTAKTHLASNLIDLVQRAYEKTPQGSFVNTLKDVVASNWIAYDWDRDPDADAVLFFRVARPDEKWRGYKIQGIGHDTQRTSIDKVLVKVRDQLRKPGWWIEASDAMEHILYKDSRIPVVRDEQLLNKLYPNSNVKILDDKTKPAKYERRAGTATIKETTFGIPKLR